MKPLITLLLIAAFVIPCGAQSDKTEIRRLIADLPFTQALDKAKGENIILVGYWIMSLASCGEKQSAYKAAEQFKQWSQKENTDDANFGYFMLAWGLALADKKQEAVQVVNRFVGGNRLGRQWLVMFIIAMSPSVTAEIIFAKIRKLPSVEVRDEAIEHSIGFFTMKEQYADALKLSSHLSTVARQQSVTEKIQAAQKKKTTEPKWPEGLLSLTLLEKNLIEARSQPKKETRDLMLDSIAEEMAKHHKFRRARVIANMCKNPFIRLSTSLSILVEYLKIKLPNHYWYGKL